jgi:hypothetical protein
MRRRSNLSRFCFCTVKIGIDVRDAALSRAAGFVAQGRLTLLRGAIQIEPF